MTSKIMIVLGVLTAVGAGAGCKGEKVIQDNPQTLDELARCKKNSEEQGKLIKALEDEKARLAMGAAPPAAPGEIVVAFENSILTVRPGKPGATPPVDPKAASAASQEFINLVAKSRGAIQKCYEQALKKDTSLQARTITLTVSASFNSTTGAHRSSTFSPSLGDAFDSCMQGVAGKWQMPANVPITTFRAPVSLTPS